jgi:hypothetical protein
LKKSLEALLIQKTDKQWEKLLLMIILRSQAKRKGDGSEAGEELME